MNKVLIIFLVVILLDPACMFAQTQRTSKEFEESYDAFIRKTLAAVPEIPSVAIVVIKDDRPIFVRAYGMADKETGTKADVDTLFYIASSTKSFTAMAAALLDKEGKIKLDDPIVKYSSGISFKNTLPEKITVRNLLTHTSGLKNYPLVFRMAYSGQSDPDEMTRVFGAATNYTDANFGKFAYDNLGYNIYGVLLHNYLQKKWQDVLQEKIFDPLAMKHTTAYISRASAKKWKVAAPYMFDAATGKIMRSPLNKVDSNMQSAGGIFASISDVGRWLNMNMNDGMLDGKQVIPADVVRAVHTGYAKTTRDGEPFVGDGQYGLGWQIGKYRNETVIYHHGGFPGYSSHISYLPEKKIAVAVLTNEGFVGQRAGHMLATYVFDWWLQTPDMAGSYDKQLQEIIEKYPQWKQMNQASFAERAKRTSQLTLPAESYVGMYQNDILGTIEITANGNDLTVKMGNINCIATPFTEKDTIRVEMIPGSGEVIKFNKNAEGKIESLIYSGVTFVSSAP